jgi:hypothetical protein
MDGLFNLAKTLFGIDIEPADGLAPVIYIIHLILLCFFCLWWSLFILFSVNNYLLFNRFGIMMLNSTVSKIPWAIRLHTSTLIHIHVHLRNRVVHGWMR